MRSDGLLIGTVVTSMVPPPPVSYVPSRGPVARLAASPFELRRRKHLPGTLTHSIHTFIPEALILAMPSMEIRDWETAVFQQHALLRDNVSVVINQLKWLKILTTGSVGAYYGSTLFPVMVRDGQLVCCVMACVMACVGMCFFWGVHHIAHVTLVPAS